MISLFSFIPILGHVVVLDDDWIRITVYDGNSVDDLVMLCVVVFVGFSSAHFPSSEIHYC